ncbi:unnamed protein product [Callosobruchus maculatus]|uniref:Uncharacterized protein n=1 Tax=Callosobruchus maculatus TaxID=64391 RepID=A0A653BXH5_CALMS|nr:unnamed protein product [Callosobruchus maculatus]
MPRHTSAVFQRSFTYNAVKLFNELNSELKISFSKTKLKQSIYNKQIR